MPKTGLVRISAGRWKGQRLPVPTGARPTAARAREALFDIIAQSVRAASVLDLFAGSGALGLEALSRGAVSADFVELAPGSLEALRANVAALGLGGVASVHRGDALRFAERLAPGAYDLVFADPPYSTDAAERIAALFRRTPFARILSVEHRADLALPGDDTRRYGDTALTFFRAP